jgi:hypothetical protein
MADDTVTLALQGQVSIDDFAQAMSGLEELMVQLSTAAGLGKDDVEWVIDALDSGSALTSLRAVSKVPDAQSLIESVVREYGEVGKALETRHEITLLPAVRAAAERITSVLGGDLIESVRFETADTESLIVWRDDVLAGLPDVGRNIESYGMVEGRVQTLTSRGRLRFTLYDTLFDRAVSCYFQEGREDAMRDSWGKLVRVAGRITRDPFAGRPMIVRGITDVVPLQEGPYTFRDAAGVAPSGADILPAEQAIRRLRDAG